MPDQQYPSLKSWIIAGVIFLVLFVSIHLVAVRYERVILHKKQRVEAAYLLKHSVEKLKQEGDKIRIVALGSSLTGQGMACPDEFTDTAFHHIEFSKIFLNTHLGVLRTFMEVKVFDSLLAYPPDILLVEVDQLAYHIEQEQTLPELLSTGPVFLKNLKTTIAFGLGNYRMPEYCGKIIHETIVDSVSESNVKWNLVPIHEHREVLSLLKKLQDKGTRIVLVQIPRPAATDQVLHRGAQEKAFQVLMQQYQKNYKMDYWAYPNLLPYTYFYDLGHLNQRGRILYSQWLYSKLEKEIQ